MFGVFGVRFCVLILSCFADLCRCIAPAIVSISSQGKTPEELAILHVGKIDPKRHLEQHVNDLMASNIVQSLGTMLDTVVF